jgi:membrane associated rhomboid family serine protease
MTDPFLSDGARRREPIFFMPIAVVALVAALIVFYAVLINLGEAAQDFLVRELAFSPGRLTVAIWPDRLDELLARVNSDPNALAQAQIARELLPVPGGALAWTFVTYALLHASWPHVILNAIWLVAFGPPIARRFGAARFFAFFAFTAAAGALAQWAVRPMEFAPMIGASAADSGLMAAAARFIFQPGAPLGGPKPDQPAPGEGDDEAAPPLGDLIRQRRAVLFIAIWMATNFIFGAGAQTLGASDAPVAWIAHTGGFVAGLLAFPLFDRRRRREAAV